MPAKSSQLSRRERQVMDIGFPSSLYRAMNFQRKERLDTLRLLGVATFAFLSIAAGPASAQNPELLAQKLSSSYEVLKGLSVTLGYQHSYHNDFLEYRNQSGYPLPLRWPSTHGEVKWFAQNSMFGRETKSWYGNGPAQSDNVSAWDGVQWQSLDRMNAKGGFLEIASRRNGSQESTVHTGSPLDVGFPFLVTATARRADGYWPADDHHFRITLDKLQDKARWRSLAQRIRGGVVLVDYQGQPCWKFTADGGIARGNRSSRVDYIVWLPLAAPVYPVRYEVRIQQSNILLGVFEVTEFFNPVEIAPGITLKFPRKSRNTSYTSDSRWRAKPVSVITYEFTECKFNPPLTNDDFKIDPGLASIVRLNDTGEMIYRDGRSKNKQGKGKTNP